MGIKLLTRLEIGFSHLRDQIFKNGFQDLLNPTCNCGINMEATAQDLFHSANFSDERLIVISNIWNIHNNILDLNKF